MVIFLLDDSTEKVKGYLRRFSQEIKANVFVASISIKTRDMLCNYIEQNNNKAIVIYTMNNEQGYKMKVINGLDNKLTDFNGVTFMTKQLKQDLLSIKIWAKRYNTDELINENVLSHSLKVAYIIEIFLTNSVSKGVLDLVAKELNTTVENCLNFICYIGGIHDLGKLHPAFMDKIGCIEYVKDYVKPFDTTPNTYRHEFYMSEIIKDNKLQLSNCESVSVRRLITTIIKNHHECKSNEDSAKGLNWFRDAEQEQYLIDEIKETEKYIYSLFEYEVIAKVNLPYYVSFLITHILIHADWLASSECFVDLVLNSMDDLNSFKNNVQDRTLQLFSENNLAFIELNNYDSFQGLYTSYTPNNLQKTVENLFKDNNPYKTVLIEAPTGYGKTKASLYMAMKIANQLGKSGVYFALPTLTTVTAMEEEYFDFVEKTSGTKGIKLTSLYTQDYYAEDKTFYNSRANLRLFERNSFGTIDQLLVGIKTNKYEGLRLLALLGKVLVLDEIHSYDAYMLEEIKVLLQWCDYLEIPVIMLSASLSSRTKEDLLKNTYDITYKASKDYPLITMIHSKNRVTECAFEIEHCKNYHLSLQDGLDDYTNLCNSAKSKIKDGGCACIIYNTVSEAQKAYNYLRNNSDNIELILYHSKMYQCVKDAKIDELLTKFGKDRNKRPKKAIVVATQIIEQSLNVDFDYIDTAIAPIDLLIQRFGRCQRFSNIDVLDGVVTVWYSKDEDYYRHYPFYDTILLEETKAMLLKNDVLSNPSNIRFYLDNVYNDSVSTMLHSKALKEQKKAELCNIESPFENRMFEVDSRFKVFAPTRNGRPTVSCALITKEELSLIGQISNDREQAITFKNTRVVNIELDDFDTLTRGIKWLKDVVLLELIDNKVVIGKFEYLYDDELGLIKNKI